MTRRQQNYDSHTRRRREQMPRFYAEETPHTQRGQCGKTRCDPPFRGVDFMPDSGRVGRWRPVGKHQQRGHGEEIQRGLPERARGLVVFFEVHIARRRGFGPFVLEENQVHQHPDDDTEHDRPDGPGDAERGAENTRGHHDGQHVDRRAGVEKRHRRTESRAAHIDSAE